MYINLKRVMSKEKKLYKWYKIGGYIYAQKFPEPFTDLAKAKTWLRKRLNVTRLPNGTEIY
jgi:hypothetical protein